MTDRETAFSWLLKEQNTIIFFENKYKKSKF
jgi:hypothetical protein